MNQFWLSDDNAVWYVEGGTVMLYLSLVPSLASGVAYVREYYTLEAVGFIRSRN